MHTAHGGLLQKKIGVSGADLVCIEGKFKTLDNAEDQDIEAAKGVNKECVGLICILQGRPEASNVDMGNNPSKGMKEVGTMEGESEVSDEEEGSDGGESAMSKCITHQSVYDEVPPMCKQGASAAGGHSPVSWVFLSPTCNSNNVELQCNNC